MYENSCVCGCAIVRDYAHIHDDSRIYDNAQVSGNVFLLDKARIYGNSKVSDKATILGFAQVTGEAQVSGSVRISGNAHLSGKAYVEKMTDYFVVGPIGSRGGYTTFATNDGGEIVVSCGCFSGSIQEFENKVHKEHSGTRHEEDYMLAIEFAKRKMKYRSL